ncbi:FHA domain-containing protein [Aurantivibrio plasticivorans]
MLKIRFKNNKLNAVWLVEPKVTIGRASGNDLVVDDPNVADAHAEITVKYESLNIVNVSGNKPVYVNRKAINHTAPLSINDEIIIGKTILQIVDPKSDRPVAPKSAKKAPPSTGWALKANSTALANRVFSIKATTVIGRSNECDITLAAAHLSRRHAQLTVNEGLLYVKDLGSANGTYLNGERITESRVNRGDDLRFDTLSFGVIGPSQDLDKTTVRPANQQTPAPQKAAAKQHKAPVHAVKGNTGALPIAEESSDWSDSDEFGTDYSTPEPKSKFGLILGVLILGIAAAVAVGVQQGLITF